jgi:hypothetical protein
MEAAGGGGAGRGRRVFTAKSSGMIFIGLSVGLALMGAFHAQFQTATGSVSMETGNGSKGAPVRPGHSLPDCLFIVGYTGTL